MCAQANCQIIMQLVRRGKETEREGERERELVILIKINAVPSRVHLFQ